MTSGARILSIEEDHIIIEKTGHKEETHDLYLKLEPYGLMEFVRSGRVAISKSKRSTEAYIKELENSESNRLSIKDFQIFIKWINTNGKNKFWRR